VVRRVLGDHYTKPYCDWFAERGGVLCHLRRFEFAECEHRIGVGVDAEIVRPDRRYARDTVVFDFPFDPDFKDPAATFDSAWVEVLRQDSPTWRIIGTGRPDAPNRHLFDEWIPYGLEHSAYVTKLYGRALALVVGSRESVGLGVAEAQVAGACVLTTDGRVERSMLCAGAGIFYDENNPSSLAGAVREAAGRDHELIRRRASAKFDFARVAERTRAAIGL
jgi:hypothetical protein